MKYIPCILIFLLLMNNGQLAAQSEPEITISFLSNDKIADINTDREKYIKNISEVSDLMKKEFKDLPQDQKIALFIISHKSGNPTIEFYSIPKIEAEREQRFLNELNSLQMENTKLVDFPILLTVNVKDSMLGLEFKEIVTWTEKGEKEYANGGLRRKYELNKSWAIKEVLPVLARYQTIVEDKFAGVKRFGTMVENTDFSKEQDVPKLTANNSDYWRANLEMGLGNQLIPATKIFMHVSQGEFDYALKYLEIVMMFSNPKTIAGDYLNELWGRMQTFNKQLTDEINKGIAYHDKGNYQKAITVYTDILSRYPKSAWATYELYFSQNALDLKNKKIKVDDRSEWDKAKQTIYKWNPLYNMDVRASNAREGYLMFRRQEINNLFKVEKDKLADIYKYADIAMDLGVDDFAAQLFWYAFTYSKGENKEAMKRFLYCIEVLGVTDLKKNFKDDFDQDFIRIEMEKEKEMKSSPIYKAFKE